MPAHRLVALALASLLAGCGLLGGPRAPQAPEGFVSALLARQEAAGMRAEMQFDAGTLFVAYLQATKSVESGAKVYRLYVASKAEGGAWQVDDTGEELPFAKPDKAFLVGPNGGLHLLILTTHDNLVHLHKPPGGEWERTMAAEEGGRGPSLLWGADGRLHGMWSAPDFSRLEEGTWRPGELWQVVTVFPGDPAVGNDRADTVMLYDRAGVQHAAFILYTSPGGRKLRHASRVPGGGWQQEIVSSRRRVNFGGSLQVTPDGTVHMLATEGDTTLRHVSLPGAGKWQWEFLDRSILSPRGGTLLQRPDGALVALATTGNMLHIGELPFGGAAWSIRSLPLNGVAGSEVPAAALDANGYLHIVVCVAPEGTPPSQCAPVYLGQVER